MDVDLGRVHVGEAELDIEAAAREGPIGRAGNLQNKGVRIDRGHPRRHLGSLLADEADHLLSENVGMNIKGARPIHLRLLLGGSAGGSSMGGPVRKPSAASKPLANRSV